MDEDDHIKEAIIRLALAGEAARYDPGEDLPDEEFFARLLR